MIDKYYIGWVRSGKDGKGLVKYRPRKQIANAVTTMTGGGIAETRDGLGNATPHIVYKFEENMKLRIIPITAYNGCIPVTVYMVQKYVVGGIFGKWVNIKGFSDKKKAEALMSLLKH